MADQKAKKETKAQKKKRLASKKLALARAHKQDEQSR